MIPRDTAEVGLMRACVLIALVVSALWVAPAGARPIESWSYERLFKEADVVVIASAQGTVDSDDKAADGRWGASLVGQRTTFSVISTLKGQVGEGPIAVRHFKLREGVLTADGPLLVAFRTKELKIDGDGMVKYKVILGPPQYLLFLRKAGGGRFEPVSGQIDPALSVKEIYAPLPAVMDGK